MRYLRTLVTLLIVVVSAAYLYFNWDLVAGLGEITLSFIGLVVFITLLQFVLNGYTFALVVKMTGTRLDALETVGLSFLTSFGNYLGPSRPGAAMKAVYLKVEKGLDFSQFAAILTAYFVAIVFVTGLSGSVLLSIDLWLNESQVMTLLLFCLAIGVGALVLFFVPLPMVRHSGRLAGFVNRAREGFVSIRTQWAGLSLYVLLIVLQYVLTAWVLMVAFEATGQPPLGWLAALIIAVFIVISSFVTLTPNNIGIQEVVAAYLYSLTGSSFDEGLLGLALIRAVHLVLSFTLGPLVVVWMLHAKRAKVTLLGALRRH